ncbi:PIN domain-like protein [Annulohypoxylon moriforme]|nr:PIN domain-like protein [Annulohypoxylon moriforme]
MGLKGFWLKERAIGETKSISQWSSDFFEFNHRPLRIAVDQANWWYKNVTPQKEAEIQRISPGSHPRELRILERICYLLRMNVQLIFVFDGPHKLDKRRPHGQTYSEQNVALLKELLSQLGVPYHVAPGEAEAECARLQVLGVVDAVWSDDSDTFMFGCKTLVQFYRPEGSEFKSEDDILVYTADSLINRSKLSQQAVLMYAILVGCDYADGLPNFGPSTFLDLVKHQKFQETATILAASVSNGHKELSKWRAMLFRMVKDTFPSKNFTIPPNTFPNLKVLEGCSRPNASSDHKLIGLVSNWFRPFGPNFRARYDFLLSHFHSRKSHHWPVEYLVPIELNHRLREKSNDFNYGITEKTAIKSKKQAAAIMVDPLLVIPDLLDITPPGYEFKKVEAILLDCVIRHALPDLTEKTIEKKSRGRPKKFPPQDNIPNQTASKESREVGSHAELNLPDDVLNKCGPSRKRDSSSLQSSSSYTPLDLSSAARKKFRRLEGQENQNESANADTHERGFSERLPIMIDDKARTTKQPKEPTVHKKPNFDVSSLDVIDLTEAD